jgi:hypothetical protein
MGQVRRKSPLGDIPARNRASEESDGAKESWQRVSTVDHQQNENPDRTDLSEGLRNERPAVVDIPEVDALRMETLLLKKQLLRAEFEKLTAAENSMHTEMCTRLGLVGRYKVDLAARKAFRVDE